MKKNLEQDQKLDPEYNQTSQANGAQKGICVDPSDPSQLGKARVAMYGLQGDYPNLDISCLTYAEPAIGIRGAYSPPQLGDRVLVSHEVGSRYAPIYTGYWNAIPTGQGMLPQNTREGSEIRPEVRLHRNLYPECMSLGATGEGTIIYFRELWLNKKYLCSSLNLVDSGNKYFKISSINSSLSQPWVSMDRFPDGPGGLYQNDSVKTQAARTGFETLEDTTQSAGAIEFGLDTIQRKTFQSDVNGNCDQMLQQNMKDSAVDCDDTRFNATVLRSRLQNAALSMFGSAAFLTGANGVFLNPPLMPPQRWDIEANSSNDVGDFEGGYQGTA